MCWDRGGEWGHTVELMQTSEDNLVESAFSSTLWDFELKSPGLDVSTLTHLAIYLPCEFI